MSLLSPASSLAKPLPAPGEGLLAFHRVGERTVVSRALARSPLRLLTPKNHGHGAWAYTTSFGGGLVDGDVLSLNVHVGPGATGFLSTQGPTRVYRSPQGCESRLDARIEDGGLLIGLLDPTALFADARCAQHTRLELRGSRSSAVWLEVLTSGRARRGERWAFSRWEGRLDVLRDGAPLVQERVLLTPEHGPLPERMGRFDALATLLMTGPALVPFLPEVQRAIESGSPQRRSELVTTCNRRHDDTLMIRIAGTSVESVVRRAHACLPCVGTLLGDQPLARRA